MLLKKWCLNCQDFTLLLPANWQNEVLSNDHNKALWSKYYIIFCKTEYNKSIKHFGGNKMANCFN